ncbi:hypothetical protein TorRG33x02_217410, partial [Trema orientale]
SISGRFCLWCSLRERLFSTSSWPMLTFGK